MQNAGEEASGDLGGALADLAVEVLGALHDEHFHLRVVPFEDDARRGTTEGTAHDDDIVISGGFHEVKKGVVVGGG